MFQHIHKNRDLNLIRTKIKTKNPLFQRSVNGGPLSTNFMKIDSSELWTTIWLVLLFHTPLQSLYKVAKNWKATNLFVTFDNGNANNCILCHSELINAACRKSWSQGLCLRHLEIEWGVGAGSESGSHDWGRGHYPHQENIESAQTNGNNDPWWGNNGEGSPGSWLVLNLSQAGWIPPLGISPAPDASPRSV